VRLRNPLEQVLAGGLAGGAALAVGELLAAGAPGAVSPLAGLGRALISAAPGAAVDVGVAVVGETDKPLLAAALLLSGSGAGSAAALLAPARPRLASALASAVPALGAVLAPRQGAARPASEAAGLGAAITSQLLHTLVVRRLTPAGLPALAALTTGATAAACATRARRRRAHEAARTRTVLPPALTHLPTPRAEARAEVPGLAPLITAAEDLYKVDVTFPTPRVHAASWRLRVHGDVSAPLELSLSSLLGHAALTEVDALLVCVHNPVGGHRMGNGRWTAVPVAALVRQAGLPADLLEDPGRGEVVARSLDGFAAVLPLELVLERGLVAVGLGGQPLPAANGYPARLLLPGRYGYAGNIKWLSRLEVRRSTTTAASAAAGYWTRRGWPVGGGRVAPSSRIDVPTPGSRVSAGRVTVAGYAWAPPLSVRGVEVSVDGGPWRPAELAAELSPLSWRAWSLTWHAESGRHDLRVRCLSDSGRQEERTAASYPDGPRGLHTVPVHVVAGLPTSRPGDGARLVGAEAAARLRLAVAAGRAWR